VRSPLAAASAALLVAACATSKPAPAPAAPPERHTPVKAAPVEVTSTGTPGQAVAVRAERMLGTVRSVDLAERSVMLEWKGGGIVTFGIGPEVKLLDELSAGDAILIDVEQQLLLEVQQPGTENVPFTASGTRAVDAPNGIGSSGIQTTVTVTKVDLSTRLVRFADPAGATYDVKAGPGLQLEKLKAGDRLLATYVQAVALRLEKVAAKP